MKQLLALLALLGLFGCKPNGSPSPNRFSDPTGGNPGTTSTGNTKKKDSFFDYSQSGYFGQLAYIVASTPEEVAQFNAAEQIAEKLADSTITWISFDRIDLENQSSAVKQELAVIVLRNKGLIGLARADPQNREYQTAMTKYIDNLIETRYFGYSLLYAALQQCIDQSYVRRKASEIMAYSVTETFHQDYLNNPALSADWRCQKVEEDLICLSKIRDLAN